MTTSRRWLGLLLLLPRAVSAQVVPDLQSVDSVLTGTSVDSLVATLDEEFAAHLAELLPDLAEEERAILAQAVEQAFAPEVMRTDVARALAARGNPQVVATLIALQKDGAAAEIDRIAAAYTAPQTLQEFSAALVAGTVPRDRLQLMAALVEARGQGDFRLLVSEAARQAAHQLVEGLGGQAPFAPMPPEQFQAAYRDRTLTQAIAYLHRYATVPDDLIRRALDELGSEAGQWYVESYLVAVGEALAQAGARAGRLAAAEPERAPDPAVAAIPELSAAEAAMPCRGVPCGFVLDWTGTRPPPYNRAFGAAEDLEPRVLERLAAAGYRFLRGNQPNGITVRLRPRITMGLCEAMSGTDNTGCPALDQVTVDFEGTVPGVTTPERFVLRNRCGDQGLLAVDGFSILTAMRLDYALTTFEGDRRQVPRC